MGVTAFIGSSNVKKFSTSEGFTLIELLTVITILAILAAGLIAIINPIQQIGRANDGRRQHDLEQIENALNAYYNDTHCFPSPPPSTSTFTTDLAGGAEWTEGGVVYMKTIPKDPGGSSYIYLTDTSSSCPQWNVLFAKRDVPAVSSTVCPIVGSGTCSVPADYSSTTYACTFSGDPPCF